MKVNNTIVVSIGQAGNQIAASFWKTICQEHGIDPLTGQTAKGKDPAGQLEFLLLETRRVESAVSCLVP
jgi:hypothetical protein